MVGGVGWGMQRTVHEVIGSIKPETVWIKIKKSFDDYRALHNDVLEGGPCGRSCCILAGSKVTGIKIINQNCASLCSSTIKQLAANFCSSLQKLHLPARSYHLRHRILHAPFLRQSVVWAWRGTESLATHTSLHRKKKKTQCKLESNQNSVLNLV